MAARSPRPECRFPRHGSRSPKASQLVRWSRAHPNFDFAVQLDLNAEWASFRWPPVSAQPPGSGLRDPAGYLPNDARYIAQHARPEEVAAEFRAQIDAAKAAGLPVSHLDSHGGIELYTPWLFGDYWKAAQDAGLPAVLAKDWVRQRGRPTAKPNIYDVGGAEVNLADVPFDHILQMGPGVARENWLKAYEIMLTGLPPEHSGELGDTPDVPLKTGSRDSAAPQAESPWSGTPPIQAEKETIQIRQLTPM